MIRLLEKDIKELIWERVMGWFSKDYKNMRNEKFCEQFRSFIDLFNSGKIESAVLTNIFKQRFGNTKIMVQKMEIVEERNGQRTNILLNEPILEFNEIYNDHMNFIVSCDKTNAVFLAKPGEVKAHGNIEYVFPKRETTLNFPHH